MSMAYQPKSYRKFLAGTVSAAVVASAIAPVASAASFTDVAGSVHADDIATLVAKGYIKGYSDNTFKPNKSLTRGEAAIIFSRILKDAGVKAPEQGAGFPDVPASNAELAEAVAIVKAAGVMGGDEKGNFNPNATITREQMAKVVVEAFKLTKPANHTTKVTDLDKAGAWAREYIQTLEANGVTKNTEFMPKQSVTRGQFASFVVRAMEVKKEVSAADIAAVKLVDEKTLEVTFNGELKEPKKEDFAIQGVEIESVSIKAAAAAEAKTTVVVIKTKTALEEGKSYSVSYKGQTTDKAKVDVPVVTPKVESVSAINARQIEIKFNKAVDAKSAETLANYTVKEDTTDLLDGTAAKAELQADGKTVIVTLEQGYSASPAFNQKTLSVKVKNVKTADGSTVVPEYSTDVKVFDTVVPTVTDIRQVSPTEFDVVFSEPVTAANNSALTNSFRINNGAYSFSTKTRVDDVKIAPNVVRITTFATLAEGEYTLTINDGITDYAGFKVTKTDKTFTVKKDATAVTASVTKVSGNKVYVEFNKKVKNFDNSNVKYHLDYSTNDSFKATTVEANPENEKGIILTFASPVTPGAHKLFISYANATGTQIEDVWGNKFAAGAVDFSVAADTTAPVVTKAEYNKTTGKIEVTFSEHVSGATAVDAYELKDANGNKVNISEVAVKADTDNLVYQLTPSTPLEGNYTLKVLANKITDTSVEKNKLAETTLNIGVADATPPTVAGVTYGGPSNKQIFISYSEAMRTSGEGSVLDKNLYVVDGTNLANIEGATIALGSDNKSVVITMPTAVSASTTLAIGRVADAAGNFSVFQVRPSGPITNADGTLAILAGGAGGLHTDVMPSGMKVKVLSSTQVEFYVDRQLTAVDASKITVATDASPDTNVVTATSASYTNTTVKMADGTTKAVAKITATFPEGTFTTAGALAVVAQDNLIVAPNAFTTVLGTVSTAEIKAGEATFADKAAPVVAKTATDLDNDASTTSHNDVITIDGDGDGDVDQIQITFTETLATLTSLPAAAAKQLFEVSGYNVTGADVSGAVATVDVEPVDAATASQTPTITIKNLEDVNGNVIATTTVTAYDRVVAAVTGDFTNADARVVRINFSEAMKEEDLVVANFSSVAGGSITNFVKGANNKYVIITFTNPLASANTVVVDNDVRDANGNVLHANTDVTIAKP